MARAKSSEPSRARSKAASIEEVSRGIKQFQEFLDQVEDLGREGFPYLDAARARTELQFRESIRKHFGERSPEFQTHKYHKLLVGSPGETHKSVALIKSLIATLEDKKLDLQGLKPPPPSTASTPSARPQMTLVPPSAPTAQVTFTPSAPVMPPPVTMSVALTTNLDMASSTGPRTPQIPATPAADSHVQEPLPTRSEPAATPPAQPQPTVQAATPQPTPAPVTPLHSDSQRIRLAVPSPSQESPPVAHASSKPPVASTPAPLNIVNPVPSDAQHPAPRERQTSASTQHMTSSPTAPTSFPIPTVPPVAPPAPLVPSPIQQTDSKQQILEFVKRLCHRFHAVARQLRLRGEYRSTLTVEDEFDVQDLFHALLRLQFDDIGTDEWTPSYAEGSSRTTFLLDQNHLAVVVKKTRPGLSTKDLADQFHIDADRYRAKHGCGTLLCFVYDPEGRVGNPRGLEADHSNTSAHFTIDVLVAPK